MQSSLVPQRYLDLVLRVRLYVLTAMSGGIAALLSMGVAPIPAAAIAVAATVGGAEVGCRLTLPVVAPRVVVSVLVLVLALVVNVVRLGYPAPECLAVVLAAAWCAAELARRVTGLVFRSSSLAA
jgi:hypothetical protein